MKFVSISFFYLEMAIISANQLETPSISIKSIVPINQRVNRMKVHQKRIRGILQIFLFLQKNVQSSVGIFSLLRSHVIIMKGLRNYLGKLLVIFGVENEGNQGKVDNFQIFWWKNIYFFKRKRKRGSTGIAHCHATHLDGMSLTGVLKYLIKINLHVHYTEENFFLNA